MFRSSFLALVLGSLILFVPGFLNVQVRGVAAASYTPAVTLGQWSKLKVMYYSCNVTPAEYCQMQNIDPANLDYGILQVVDISAPLVTLQLSLAYKNGTGSHQGVLVDVASGSTNFTLFGQQSSLDYFVLSGGLQKNETVFDNTQAPVINENQTMTILGTIREANVFNATSVNSIGPESISTAIGVVFDQSSGIFLQDDYSIALHGPFANGTAKVIIAMVDNNIWLSSMPPDFTLVANPPSINVSQETSANSTISLSRANGFSPTVTLAASSSSSAITCSVSPRSLPATSHLNSTLLCYGAPGGYTITVTGDGGYIGHSTTITVNIASVVIPDFQLSSQGPISFETGSYGSATILLHAENGFSSSVNLSIIDTPSGVSCSLGQSSISGQRTTTLTCTGQPGSYTIRIKGTSGAITRYADATVNITVAPFPYVYVGLTAAAVAAIVTFLSFRRRARRRTG